MMLFKLSVRNMRRSLRDYALYFGMLIVSVSIFYVFNSLSSQSFLQSVLFMAPEHFTANIEVAMTTISTFVSALLIFLIIYGNSFIIKRRKKELGVYLTLGMARIDVAKILIGETFLLAFFSIIAGVGIGVPLSQLMSILTFHLLDIYIPGLTFAFSWSVVFRTTLYFFFVFFSVCIVNVMIVAKSKILNLINEGSRQVNHSKFFGTLSRLSIIVAMIGIGYAAFALFTLNLDDLYNNEVSLSGDGVGVGYSTFGGSIIAPVISGLIVGTFALFLSLSGVMIFIITKSKKIAFHGLNIFTLRQLTRRLNLNWLSLSFITLMMTGSIFMLVGGLGTVNHYPQQRPAFDGVISTNPQLLERPDFDELEIVDEVFLLREYRFSGIRIDSLLNIEIPEWLTSIDGFRYEDVRVILDYHDKSIQTPSLNEVLLVVTDLDVSEEDLLVEQISLVGEIFDITLKFLSDPLLLATDHMWIDNQVILVFPDHYDFREATLSFYHHLFDFNVSERIAEPIFWDFAGEIRERAGGWSWAEYDIFTSSSNNVFNATTANWIHVNQNLQSIFLTFMSLYIGGMFLLVSLTILFLQQMIDVVESEKRYAILSQLGVDMKMCNLSLLAQGVVYFLIPLIIASIYSFLGLQLIFRSLIGAEMEGAIAADIGSISSQVMRAMIIVFAGVIIVYAAYFVLAHAQTKRMLGRKKN